MADIRTSTLTLLLMICSVLGAPSPPSTFDFQSLGKSSERFAADIYQVISKTPGNILMSPSSLHSILALIQIGANGNTLDEMSRALSLPKDKTTLATAFREVLPYTRTLKSAILDSANKVFIKNGFDISPQFVEVATKSFNAEIENTDFSQKTIDVINQWVEQKTNKKIKNLIKQEDIDSSTTQMVLVNALYFKGDWENPFDKELTQKRNFFTNVTHSQLTEMMVTEHSFNFNEDNELDAKFLELPYAGKEFTMTLILPNKRDGLPALESKLDVVLKPQEMSYQDVIVSIPKFKFEQSINLNNPLKQLGMNDAFSDLADLTGLSTSKRDLKISKVIQKTFIEVNEKGTEAAAASAGFVVDRIFGGYSFHADHPFLFVLRQTSTGIVEFIGRYSSPN